MGVHLFTHNDFSNLDDDTRKTLDNLFRHCHVMLGGSSVDVYLENEDYETALSQAIGKYQDMSSRAVKLGLGILVGESSRQVYQMPPNVDNVRAIQRTTAYGLGSANVSGTLTAAMFQNIFKQVATGGGAGGFDIVSFDQYMQQLETIQRMFAYDANWWYDESNSLLYLYTPVYDEERILVEVSVLKSIRELMSDHFAFTWLRDYTLAVCKIILGRKLGVFEVMPGPLGGVTTSSARLLQEGTEEMTALETSLYEYSDSPPEIPPIIRG